MLNKNVIVVFLKLIGQGSIYNLES